MKCILVCLLGFVFIGCNKEKLFSNRLMKGDVWEIESINRLGSTPIALNGAWEILDADIYEDVPLAIWHELGSEAYFSWQFRDNGDKFKLVYTPCEGCSEESYTDLDYNLYFLTGTYEVLKCSRNELHLESEELLGYGGNSVNIKLNKQQ